MNYKEKRLAEFDKWVKNKRDKDPDFNYGVGSWVVDEISLFIAESIDQSVAEERARMRWEARLSSLDKPTTL